MSGGLHLTPGRVAITRDIIVDGNAVGVISHFERSGRTWIDVALDDSHEGHGYEAEALQVVLDRLTEMKIPVASAFIVDGNDYLGSIFDGLGFTVFQVTHGMSLMEKKLL